MGRNLGVDISIFEQYGWWQFRAAAVVLTRAVWTFIVAVPAHIMHLKLAGDLPLFEARNRCALVLVSATYFTKKLFTQKKEDDKLVD